MRRVVVCFTVLMLASCGGETADTVESDAGAPSDAIEDVAPLPTEDVEAPDSVSELPDSEDGHTDAVDASARMDVAADLDSLPELPPQEVMSVDVELDGGDVDDADEVGPDVPDVPVVVPGDQCTEGIPIDPAALPFEYTGDTIHAADDVSLGGGCGTGGDIGAGAPDVVFSFTPEVTAHHVIGMNPATVIGDSPAVIYVVEDCEDAAFSCVGVSGNLSAGGVFSVYLEAGVNYAIVVDGLLAEDSGGFSFVVEEVICVIDCPGPECGKDGCGGFCGTGCADDMACRPDGYCDEPALIEGNTCVAPYLIESLPFATSGDTWYGTPEAMFAAASCPGEPNTIGAASNDHFYQLAIETTGLYFIAVTSDYDSAVYVITDCTAPSASCLAGSDESLSLESFEVYLTAGQVVTIVVDGYGNDENMNGIYTLQVSQACVASCEGKVCGDDGCGGSCGDCTFGEACEEGVCVVAPEGDTCLDPFVISSVPATLSGDTTEFGADLGYGPGDCPGMELGWGAGSKDVVYAFQPTVQDLYTITLHADFDSTLYVITDCLDVPGTCIAAADQHPTDEVIDVWMYPDTTYFIVVDGYGNLSSVYGEYELTLTPACVPQCKFKECGPDGCGGECGECDPMFICTDDGLCESQEGNSCETPFVIEEVPFSGEGDTSDGTNLMGVPYDGCPGETAVRGPSSAEEVWAFTPTETGVYTALVETDFPVVLYVLTDCTLFTVDCFFEQNPGPLVWYDVHPECGWALFDQGQCVGLANGFMLEDAYAEVRAPLEAGTTYYFVVDGNALNVDYSGPYTLSLDGPCFPECEGKQCGADGCGLDCGECSPDTLCDSEQQCVTQEGNSCETPFVVPEDVELPVVFEGSTTDASNAYGKPYGICPFEDKKAGAGSRDEVYAFTPPEDGMYEFHLEAVYQGALYVLNDCAQYTSDCFYKETLGHDSWTAVVAGCGFDEEICLGAFIEDPDDPEALLEVELVAGETVYIVVDGLGGLYDTYGPYTLSIDRACDPQCEDKECGDDGCEDVCGVCPGGFICNDAYQCIDETFTQGNTCDNPMSVGDLPFLAAGDTSNDSDVYSGADCPGMPFDMVADGARDEVWSFEPAQSGVYLIDVAGQDGFEPLVYLVSDCSDETWACNKGTDDVTMDVALEAGQTYFIIIDGGTDPDDPPPSTDGGYVLEVSLP